MGRLLLPAAGRSDSAGGGGVDSPRAEAAPDGAGLRPGAVGSIPELPGAGGVSI